MFRNSGGLRKPYHGTGFRKYKSWNITIRVKLTGSGASETDK